mmetsp:Transcript_25276/g.84987  ORF Transcript_25276/g.84987 Transcript_25276/m.84987 type:complete len:245 (+) Transcript_25276:861-1595(+)
MRFRGAGEAAGSALCGSWVATPRWHRQAQLRGLSRRRANRRRRCARALGAALPRAPARCLWSRRRARRLQRRRPASRRRRGSEEFEVVRRASQGRAARGRAGEVRGGAHAAHAPRQDDGLQVPRFLRLHRRPPVHVPARRAAPRPHRRVSLGQFDALPRAPRRDRARDGAGAGPRALLLVVPPAQRQAGIFGLSGARRGPQRHGLAGRALAVQRRAARRAADAGLRRPRLRRVGDVLQRGQRRG